MPHGTATNKLKKALLFSLVQKCKEDLCYRCGQTIETVEELSIEHKKAWENVSIDLFWELDNIAFSHLKCNKPHSYNNGRKKLRPSENHDWCYVHQEFHTKDKFNVKHHGFCREGQKLRMQKLRINKVS